MVQTAIDLSAVCKVYRGVSVLDRLTFSLRSNRIVGLLGRNGAGKSTTMRMLVGLTTPSSGAISVLGQPLGDATRDSVLRRRIAYVPEAPRLYEYMRVAELVAWTRIFYDSWLPDREKWLMREWEIPPQGRLGELSKGTRSKVTLLLAFSRPAELLILDEPTEGLDPGALEVLVYSIKKAISEGATVVYSSHHLAEVARIADESLIVHRGRSISTRPISFDADGPWRVAWSPCSRIHESDFPAEDICWMCRQTDTTVLIVRQLPDAFRNTGTGAANSPEIAVARIGLEEMFGEVTAR